MLEDLLQNWYSHVLAEGLQSMKVSLAAQVFNIVAVSMSSCITAKKIKAKAKETVEFVDKINNLIDSVNGTTVKPLNG